LQRSKGEEEHVRPGSAANRGVEVSTEIYA
jgi:hypothetical protein